MLFTSAARYYADYRPRYPLAMFRVLADRFKLNYESLVLDIGCGPGVVLLPMSRFAGRVVGVDPEPEMLREARQRTPHDSGIVLVQSTAEHLLQFRDLMQGATLATFGRSFHWTNRRFALQVLDELLAPAGGVVILGGPGWRDSRFRSDPEQAALEVLRDLEPTAMRYRRFDHVDVNPQRHETVLKNSAFSEVDELYFPVTYRWTVPDYMRMLATTSYGAQIIEARGAAVVQAAVFDKLRALALGGVITRRGVVTVTIGRRPKH